MDLEFGPFLQPVSAAARAERCALRTLDRCMNELGLDDVPLPIPVEEWIEHPLGYEFGVEDLSHLGAGVLGATYVDERRIVVDPSVTSHDGRFRFTAAHELGHMLLHADTRRRFQESVSLRDAGDRRLERQADRFAAALLMPIKLVLRELFAVCDEKRLDRGEAFSHLMADTPESEWLWRTWCLPALTRRFGVSRAAAMNRFQDIRFRTDKSTFLPGAVARRIIQHRASERPRFRVIAGKVQAESAPQSSRALFQ